MGMPQQAGAVVYVHADGDLHDLADDLLTCPIEVLNLQDQVNGIDWIRDRLKGRVCIDLDLDRQHLTVNGSAQEIDEHIHRAIAELADPSGGLMLSFNMGPEVSEQRGWAVADAMERYCELFGFLFLVPGSWCALRALDAGGLARTGALV
ncbi:MAG: hypothetical protein PF961_23545 [Planctomycetota bacterium]|nr:hypothetical protein [Planctomycetota bacterium]